MIRITAIALLAGFVAGQETAAQTPQPSNIVQSARAYVDQTGGLSLAEAIERAIANEPSLRAARADIDVARGMRLQAGLRPNPTASFERREEPAGTDNQTMVGVEWPLDLFRRTGRVQVAERELEVAQLSAADRERLLASEVRMRYGEAAAAVRELMIAEDLVAAARRQFDLLRARVDSGAAPPLERDLLDVELQRLESERLLALGSVDAAMAELKRWLGLAPDAPLMLRETLEALVARELSGDQTSAAPDAARQRADVREAEAQVRRADARVDRARREGRFDVSLFASYMRMDAGFPQLGVLPGGSLERVRGLFHYVTGGAMVMVPVLNRNQGEVQAAQAERAGAAARLEAVELSAKAEIASAAARDAQARRAVALYSSRVRGLARQNLDVVGQTFELGRATVFDVLTEQRRFLETERAYVSALREAWEASTALKRARGDVR
jgi:cobalt-zinc-cadmium efflux system outer membrane protein